MLQGEKFVFLRQPQQFDCFFKYFFCSVKALWIVRIRAEIKFAAAALGRPEDAEDILPCAVVEHKIALIQLNANAECRRPCKDAHKILVFDGCERFFV